MKQNNIYIGSSLVVVFNAKDNQGANLDISEYEKRVTAFTGITSKLIPEITSINSNSFSIELSGEETKKLGSGVLNIVVYLKKEKDERTGKACPITLISPNSSDCEAGNVIIDTGKVCLDINLESTAISFDLIMGSTIINGEMPTKLSQLENDEGFITAEDIPSFPSKLSEFDNDTNFITEEDMPSIPTKTSELTNDSGFITASAVPASNQTFIDLWNVACGIYGQYNASTGYFELNGLLDITYEQALAIYDATAHMVGNLIDYRLTGQNLFLESSTLGTYNKSSNSGNEGSSAEMVEDNIKFTRITPVNNGNFYVYPKLAILPLDIKTGDVYTVSFEYRHDNSKNLGLYNYLFNVGSGVKIPPANEWTVFSVTQKFTADKKVTALQVFGFNDLVVGSKVDIRNLKLEKGDKSKAPIRTNLSARYFANNDIQYTSYLSDMEVVNLRPYNDFSYTRTTLSPDNTSLANSFYGNSKLKKVIGSIGVANLTGTSLLLNNSMPLLEEIEIAGVRTSFGFLKQAPAINLSVLSYLINNSTADNPIVVTVHSTVYNKLVNPDIYPSWGALVPLAQTKNITFAV